ncbi:unnamed protein product [Ambrosiozyma monospora]|uniref:Unnamed protein product n=1 Tax=Ambrosiozyma monospora TaxID=43982 RepID=A0ACB5TAS0_AMBMO|nr:unnamed protein product [Ambrosiozyma monospora]
MVFSEEEYEVADILSSPLQSPSQESQSYNEFHATHPNHHQSPADSILTQTQRNNLNTVNRRPDSQAELDYLDRKFNDAEDNRQTERANPMHDDDGIDGSESENENGDQFEPVRKKAKYVLSNSISSLPSIQEQSVNLVNSQPTQSISFDVPSSGSIQVTSTQRHPSEPPNGLITAK